MRTLVDRGPNSGSVPLLRLCDVTYRRGTRSILSNVNWAITPGQHWALLGANGSGKTTLLKLITGYEWVTEGCVEVLGERFGEVNLRELRKLIGWVSFALEPHLPMNDTAADIVVSGFDASLGLYREITEVEEAQALRALDRLGIQDRAGQRYNTLSQGERQRVWIARALVHRPRLLILDEPCAGLDPAARAALLRDLGLLLSSPEAPTLILVTHHLEEIEPFISHVLVLRQGAALAAGATDQVLISSVLSAAFDRACFVERIGERYRLLLTP